MKQFVTVLITFTHQSCSIYRRPSVSQSSITVCRDCRCLLQIQRRTKSYKNWNLRSAIWNEGIILMANISVGSQLEIHPSLHLTTYYVEDINCTLQNVQLSVSDVFSIAPLTKHRPIGYCSLLTQTLQNIKLEHKAMKKCDIAKHYSSADLV